LPVRPPGHPGSADFADSGADELLLPPDSELEVLLDASFPEAAPASLDEPSFGEPPLVEPSLEDSLEEGLRDADSELVELRESVL
jgi:hypothetical protein